MIPGLLLGWMSGAALGFVFGLYYAGSSRRRSETDSAVRHTLAQIELLRGEVERVLRYIKS